MPKSPARSNRRIEKESFRYRRRHLSQRLQELERDGGDALLLIHWKGEYYQYNSAQGKDWFPKLNEKVICCFPSTIGASKLIAADKAIVWWSGLFGQYSKPSALFESTPNNGCATNKG